MADDDRQRPLLDPTLFAPTELLAEDVDHDVPVRRIEAGVLAFALLVVGFGVLTPVAATVQVSAALAVVLVGNVTLRTVGR